MYEYKTTLRLPPGPEIEEVHLAREANNGWRLVCARSVNDKNGTYKVLYYWERKIPLEGKKKYVYSCDPVAEEICGSCPKLDSCAAAEIHGYTK